jgi:hypothetical protein
MTLRQPTERHGGNAGIDEEGIVTQNSLDARVALIQSNRTWSELEEVALAVSIASESEHRIYVERRGHQYRWSLAHPGGAYPLLKITARFLGIDYTRIYVGFRTLPDGIAIICDDPQALEKPDAWVLLSLADTVGPGAAAGLISEAIEPGTEVN